MFTVYVGPKKGGGEMGGSDAVSQGSDIHLKILYTPLYPYIILLPIYLLIIYILLNLSKLRIPASNMVELAWDDELEFGARSDHTEDAIGAQRANYQIRRKDIQTN